MKIARFLKAALYTCILVGFLVWIEGAFLRQWIIAILPEKGVELAFTFINTLIASLFVSWHLWKRKPS